MNMPSHVFMAFILSEMVFVRDIGELGSACEPRVMINVNSFCDHYGDFGGCVFHWGFPVTS